jgi:3-phosphoshikimate 1-carboxyvinyltransferase
MLLTPKMIGISEKLSIFAIMNTIMQYKLSAPEEVKCSIKLPASKSISNRALILHALANGKYMPENLSDCDDTEVMVRALTQNNETIDIMAAGTAMRFLTAYLSTAVGEEHTLTGTERMRHRPIKILVEALRQLGADIEYTENEGFPPLRIRGRQLTGYDVTLKGDVSSQYISALLMVGPTLKNGLRLTLTGEVVSRPYINLTLQLMKEYGGKAEWTSENTIEVAPQQYDPETRFTVENDWSAASYWYQLAALAPKAEIRLGGLFDKSYQGDRKGGELFAKLGVETRFEENGEVVISKSGKSPEVLEADFVEIPDLAQTFVVTCALMGVKFRFTGLQSLRIKETDRISALKNEMRRLGYVVGDEADSIMYWNGERTEPDTVPVIRTYEDHRMAMAFASASLLFPTMMIANPHVVSKSYPTFWREMERAGFVVEEV